MSKRFAEVPEAMLALGELLSKATLIEIAFHLAVRCTGNEDQDEAVRITAREAETLGHKVSIPRRVTRYTIALRKVLGFGITAPNKAERFRGLP